jgi:hypothetical protein
MIPFFTVKIDKVYKIRFGMETCVKIQQLTGINIMTVDEYTPELLCKFLWVYLLDDHPELKIEDASKFIDDNSDNVLEVTAGVLAALHAAWPTVDEKNVRTTAKKS